VCDCVLAGCSATRWVCPCEARRAAALRAEGGEAISTPGVQNCFAALQRRNILFLSGNTFGCGGSRAGLARTESARQPRNSVLHQTPGMRSQSGQKKTCRTFVRHVSGFESKTRGAGCAETQSVPAPPCLATWRLAWPPPWRELSHRQRPAWQRRVPHRQRRARPER
jgi:hypothetical protein